MAKTNIMGQEIGQLDMFGGEIAEDTGYKEFTDKFKGKKTTDDCYTPPIVYDAVADWVEAEYKIPRDRFLRPFYPGGDYKRETVPEGCAVVDNPPFSILVQIIRHYLHTGVRFFLFAPTLTLFSGHERRVCYIPCGVQITYENGAKVNTSFVTNMDRYQLRTVPDLYRAVREADDKNRREQTVELPKYSYPDHVLTAAAAYQYSHYGIDFRVTPDECVFIRAMDAQRGLGKAVFGSGLLLSERAAAERAAAHVWELSNREWSIVKKLGGGKLWRTRPTAWSWRRRAGRRSIRLSAPSPA